MKRTLLLLTLVFSAGLYIVSLNINENLLFIAFFAMAFILIFMLVRKSKYALKTLFFTLAFIAGMLSFLLRIGLYDSDVSFLYGERVMILGSVYEVQGGEGETCRITIKTQEIKNDDTYVTKPIKATLYLDDYNEEYKYGDIVSLSGVFSRPASAKNLGEFDHRIYLMTKGIKLSGTARSAVLIGNKVNLLNPIDLAYTVKNYISENIDKQYSPVRSGLVKGVLIGDTTGFDDEITEAFKDSGLSHVVAVSGAHLSIILMMAMNIFGLLKIKMRSPVILIYLGVIWFFVLMVGGGVSVLRSAFMTSLFLLSRLLRRQNDPLTSLSFSVLVILLISPAAFFDVGFRLSVGATLTILLYTKPVEEKLSIFPKPIRKIIAVSCAAQIGTIPILMHHFGTVPLLSIFTNILVAPLIPIIMGAGALGVLFAEVPILSTVFVGITSFAAKIFEVIAKSYASIPFATIILGNLNLAGTLIYIFLSIAFYQLLTKNKFKTLVFTNLAMAVLVFAVVSNVLFDTAKVTFIHVGNGDCALIEVGKTEILIDSGGNFAENTGEKTVIPYLKRQGIKKVDLAVLTHYHYDHCSAFISLIENGYINKIALPSGVFYSEMKEEIENAARENNTEIVYISDTDIIKINNHCRIVAINSKVGYDENNGMVYNFNYGNKKILFTGDILEAGERKLIKENRDISCDILKVAHHGSDSSTSERFLEISNPMVAVITTGKNNFGHPDEEVLGRLSQKSIYTYRTDLNGTIIFTLRKNKIVGLKLQRSSLYEL